jgi:alkylation response protein AidB-like acyl-CoA dehydrogenase
MDVTFSEEQQALREAVAALLADHSNPREAFGSDTGADMELYGRLVELGVVELPGMVELGIVLEECGRALAAVPLASVAAASAVLPAGDVVPVLGLDLGLVADAHVATHVVYPQDGVLRAAASSAYEATQRPTVDGTRRLCAVRITGSTEELGPAEPSLSNASLRGRVALAHELVGIAQACVDMAVAHAKSREQFDRPIGVFQAVSHRCADMFVATESARSHAYFAAWAVDADDPSADLAASQAKAAAGEAAVFCAQSAIQVHGGIGFTWDHDLHLYLKRAQSGAALLGTPGEHRQRIAHLIGL